MSRKRLIDQSVGVQTCNPLPAGPLAWASVPE